MRLLLFLVLSRYGLARKCKKIFQISIVIGCRIAFSDISDIAFLYFEDQITTHRLN